VSPGIGSRLDHLQTYPREEKSTGTVLTVHRDVKGAYSAMNTALELSTTISHPQHAVPRLAATFGVPDEIRRRALEFDAPEHGVT